LFQRVSKTKTLVVGSLESDTGSEFLFGYDPARGLKWLERHGKEYSAADPEWAEAEAFILGVTDPEAEAIEAPVEKESVSVGGSITRNAAPPQQQVHRSVAVEGWEDPYPQEGDPRIVESPEGGGDLDVADDDIAAQAAQFLMGMGE
jgi:hypothetical protein